MLEKSLFSQILVSFLCKKEKKARGTNESGTRKIHRVTNRRLSQTACRSARNIGRHASIHGFHTRVPQIFSERGQRGRKGEEGINGAYGGHRSSSNGRGGALR